MNRWWTIIGVFFFIGLLVYGPSLANSFVRWDDGLLIYENPAIRGINVANLKTIFTTYDPELYIPLTLFSYQFDFLVAGTHPSFYHLHSLLLHIINAILVVWLVLLLLQNRFIAVITGLAFLLHPLNTEAVVWASGRKDLLSTMWMLLSWGLFIEYKEKMQKVQRVQRIYVMSVVAFALGLLSKVTIITLPALLILTAFFKRWNINTRFVMRLIPYGILAIIFAVIAFFGKTGVLDSSTPVEKLLIAPMSTVFYLQKMLIPTHLSVIYPFTGAVELLSARILVPIVLCALLLVIGLWSLKRTRLVFFSLGLFGIALSPSLLNFSKGDFLYFASDRYAYISSIGILLLLVSGIHTFIQNQKWKLLCTLCTLCTLAILSYRQSLVWADSETLFTHVVTLYPEAHSAHNNLGNIYRTKGQLEQSIASYEEALRLSKEFGRGTSALYGQSKILSNLASAYRVQGNSDLALQTLNIAKELDPSNQHVYLQEGIIYGMQQRTSEAEADYKKALELDPSFTTVKVNLGSLLINIARPVEAIAILEDAIAWNPFYPQAYYNLAAAYKAVGRQREAFDAYKKAVELEPSFIAARINLGILYAERGNIDDAKHQFSEILRYDPDNQRALSALQQLTAIAPE